MSSLQQKVLFWGAVTGLSSVILGGCYYLYTFFADEEEDDDIFNSEEGVYDEKGTLTSKGVALLMVKMNKLAQYYFKKEYPNKDEERRKAIDNEDAYMKLCQESMEIFQITYQAASKEILSKLPKYLSFEEFQAQIQKIDPQELEDLNLQQYEIEKEDEIEPAKAKEAFIYYAKLFLEKMDAFQKKCEQIQNPDPNIQSLLIIEMLANKMKCDDMLYLKYKTKEEVTKVTLYKNHMLLDPEIKALTDKMKEYDNGPH